MPCFSINMQVLLAELSRLSCCPGLQPELREQGWQAGTARGRTSGTCRRGAGPRPGGRRRQSQGTQPRQHRSSWGRQHGDRQWRGHRRPAWVRQLIESCDWCCYLVWWILGIFTDCMSEGGNAIASIRWSFCLFPLSLRNRLTVDLELCLRVGHDHSSQGIDGQGHRSRSRSWVRLVWSVWPWFREVFLVTYNFNGFFFFVNHSWPVPFQFFSSTCSRRESLGIRGTGFSCARFLPQWKWLW